MQKLQNPAIRDALLSIPSWRKKGDTLVCNRELKDFTAAIRFVNAVAKLANKVDHHPNIDIRWNRVCLTLTTHDAGGLTPKDFDLARQIDLL
jgi:4a-hydroxytetrahydrobiopterin dehydratase